MKIDIAQTACPRCGATRPMWPGKSGHVRSYSNCEQCGYRFGSSVTPPTNEQIRRDNQRLSEQLDAAGKWEARAHTVDWLLVPIVICLPLSLALGAVMGWLRGWAWFVAVVTIGLLPLAVQLLRIRWYRRRAARIRDS